MRHIFIGSLLLLLVGCNSLGPVNTAITGIQALDRLGVNWDTNGYQAKGSKQKICAYKKGNITTWRPC